MGDPATSAALSLGRSDPRYPVLLRTRLGSAAPDPLVVRGSPALLRAPAIAVFCSLTPPADLVLPAIDVARALAERSVVVAGGFQSPVERLMLESLLEGRGGVVLCTPRDVTRLRLTRAERAAEAGHRLLALGTAPRPRRVDTAVAMQRNRVAAALAAELLVVHAAPGGRVHALAQEASGWGVRLRHLPHPANQPLELIGSLPLESAGELRGGAPASR